MVVAYGSSKIASYLSEISESLYVALVSPVHNTPFPAGFNSRLIKKRSLRRYGYTGWLKKRKSNGTENLLSKVFLAGISWVVTVSAVPSAFLHRPLLLSRWLTVCLEVASLHVLFG